MADLGWDNQYSREYFPRLLSYHGDLCFEARTAGIGIAVALTSTEAGRITMTTHCQHITGGIWGAAFSILSDQSECSLVRQQVS